ncbi:MAG: hypothetical protein GKR93_12195 [Gammaproteobacteria bacterium]|nr:hypothetical protein [Gammaproteobacteria bacterium]
MNRRAEHDIAKKLKVLNYAKENFSSNLLGENRMASRIMEWQGTRIYPEATVSNPSNPNINDGQHPHPID